jgi:diguanylate cyclase
VTQRDLLPKRVYRFRVLGMGLAALPIGVVLHEHQAPVGSWLWGAFTCLLWPQLAYWRARRSRSRFNAELHNLMFDSAIAGSWAALLHFTVLPAVLLVTVVTADKINTGVRGLWRRSLPGLLLGMLVAGLLTGFAFEPETSMPALLACLPIMLIHTLSVSLASSRLVHRVQQQNRQLDELSRVDMLDRSRQSRGVAAQRRHLAAAAPNQGPGRYLDDDRRGPLQGHQRPARPHSWR